MDTSRFTPTRLIVARRRRGLTKKALASTANVSLRSLTDYETGARSPSLAHLKLMAATLNFPVEFFVRADLEQLQPEGVSFRSMTRMTAGQRDRALASGEMALEMSEWIDRIFTLPTPDIPDLRTLGDPEAAALALRARWGLGDKPVPHLIRLLEAQGARLFSLAEEAREVDAFSFWRDGKPFVFLNTMKSGERSRFDAAHELGHLVLHAHGGPGGRGAEQEADAFASAFLMPRSSILAHVPSGATLNDLLARKRVWRVAVSALAHRSHRVGLLTEWQYRTIAIQIQERGYRTSEPNPIPREMSQVSEKVFAELRAEGRSKSDIARELGWPVDELDALVFGMILHASTGGVATRDTGPIDETNSSAMPPGGAPLRGLHLVR